VAELQTTDDLSPGTIYLTLHSAAIPMLGYPRQYYHHTMPRLYLMSSHSLQKCSQ